LEYASDFLKGDRDVVMAAVQTTGIVLKFAKPPLNQDEQLMKAAGIFDEDANKLYERPEKALLSVKFSQAEKCSSFATQFHLAMKNDPFLKQFKAYYPNAWCKDSCDPDFTNIKHPCGGSLNICNIPRDQNIHPCTGRPCATSCWRVAFRFHQDEAKATNGFMIQVEEHDGLGDGQKIETEMAKEAAIKVFRAYTYDDDMFDFSNCNFNKISRAIEEWYANGCKDPELLENVWIGTDVIPKTWMTERPRFEQL